MKPKWLLFLLIALLLVSCKPETKSVDLPKAIKLESGTLTKVSPLPEGYSYITFTLYTPETYTGKETGSFRLSVKSKESEETESKAITTLTAEDSKGVSSSTPKETLTPEENFEQVTFHLAEETENIAFYIEDKLGARAIGEDYTTNGEGKKGFIDSNGNFISFDDFASYVIALLKKDIDEIAKMEVLFLTGKSLQDESLDLDGNGKLNIYLVAVNETFDGYVYMNEKRDCFYLNLGSLYDYAKRNNDYEGVLKDIVYSTFSHEYAHFLDFQYFGGSLDNYFKIEGFAESICFLMHGMDSRIHAGDYFPDFVLTSYHQHPLSKDDSGIYPYAVGSMFYYYLWKAYPQEEVNGASTFFTKLLSGKASLEEGVERITGKKFQDVYREFWLSVLSGMGYDFGKEVKPFTYSKEINFTPKELELAFNSAYNNQEKPEDNPYHLEDEPVEETALPGCSFRFVEWILNTENVDGFLYEADPGVETWLFAMSNKTEY